MSRPSPTLTPPSASASIISITYAGPLPERPVTASSSDSSSTTQRPTASKRARATSTSGAVACAPGAIAVAAASAMAAVLGMARTTRVPAGRRASMASMGTPAAMETTRSDSVSAAAMGARMRSTIWGLTAMTMTSAQRASASLSVLVWMPYFWCSSARRSSLTSLARICSAVTVPDWSRPRTRAPAMLPPPTKPIFLPAIRAAWSFMRGTLALPASSLSCSASAAARLQCRPMLRLAVRGSWMLLVLTSGCFLTPTPPQAPAAEPAEAPAPQEHTCPSGAAWDGAACKPVEACSVEQDVGARRAASEAECVGRAECEKQCDAGIARSCADLAAMLGKDGPDAQERALQLSRKACDGGDGDGCYQLGVGHELGKGALAKDLGRAASLYARACNCGSHRGCNDVAFALEKGQGVAQDKARAVALYVRSCDLGSALGCKNAGVMFHDGAGVRADPGRAFALSTRACEGGEAGGCNNLALMYEAGEGTAADDAQAASLYAKACGLGAANACTSYGSLFENGRRRASRSGQAPPSSTARAATARTRWVATPSGRGTRSAPAGPTRAARQSSTRRRAAPVSPRVASTAPTSSPGCASSASG